MDAITTNNTKKTKAATAAAQPCTYTIEQFCEAHKIARGTFYNLILRKQAPDIMQVGARRFISYEAAARWRKRMEKRTSKKN